MPPLPHHRAHGSVPRRFDWVKLGRRRRARDCLRGARAGRLAGSPRPPGRPKPSSITPALRKARMSLSTRLSVTRATAANIDVAVVRVAAETVTPSGQLLVEIVEHEIEPYRVSRRL